MSAVYITNLDHGRLIIEAPAVITVADVEHLEELFALILRGMRRRALKAAQEATNPLDVAPPEA